MAQPAKLEPGWLTKDVNDAANRARTLEAAAARKNVGNAPPQEESASSSAESTPKK